MKIKVFNNKYNPRWWSKFGISFDAKSFYVNRKCKRLELEFGKKSLMIWFVK